MAKRVPPKEERSACSSHCLPGAQSWELSRPKPHSFGHVLTAPQSPSSLNTPSSPGLLPPSFVTGIVSHLYRTGVQTSFPSAPTNL